MVNELIGGFTEVEREGFKTLMCLLSETYPSHDVWVGAISRSPQTIIFGSQDKLDGKRNRPAFAIYQKNKSQGPSFGLRFDDKELRALVAEKFGENAHLLRYTLASIGVDGEPIRHQLSMWSELPEISNRMQGRGRTDLHSNSVDNSDKNWLDDALCLAYRRRGQASFRQQLMELYQSRCAITGCAIESALEACHIRPHNLGLDYSPSNGLLLRSDLHRLFDAGLLAIDVDGKVHLRSPANEDPHYMELHGRTIRAPRLDPHALSSLKSALAARFASGR